MITKEERKQIRQILQSPQWGALERLANLLCDKIRDDNPIRNSEWETISTLLGREGQVRGIKTLLQEIYTQAQND